MLLQNLVLKNQTLFRPALATLRTRLFDQTSIQVRSVTSFKNRTINAYPYRLKTDFDQKH